MERKIKEALEKNEKRWWREEERSRGWWDKECVEKKREVRRGLRKWRSGKGREEDYKMEKREYRKLCEGKKIEENERWERMILNAKKEKDV